MTAPGVSGAVWDELVSELPIGVVLQDEQGEVVAANELAATVLGVSRQDLLTGSRPAGWTMRDDTGGALPSRRELSEQVLRTGSPITLALAVGLEGQPGHRLWADLHPVSVRSRRMVLVLLQPVDEQTPRARGLVDPVTGLPARALLLDRLEQSLTRSRTHGTLTSLVLLDLCALTAVNNTHGFDRGDDLLLMIGGRLRAGLREDHTVARHGGDQFAVVAEHQRGTGQELATRVRDLARHPVVIGAAQVRPQVRVAWATSDGAIASHSLFTHAEQRLRGTATR